MTADAIKQVAHLWTDQYVELGGMKENRLCSDIRKQRCGRWAVPTRIRMDRSGLMSGCRFCRPGSAPNAKGISRLQRKNSPALRLSRSGTRKKERIVLENDAFIVLVPFWAVWPYEVMVLPKHHHACLASLSDNERYDLADALKRIGTRYDTLFHTSSPYSMGIHQKPTDESDYPEWHFHFHFCPPLLRSATSAEVHGRL